MSRAGHLACGRGRRVTAQRKTAGPGLCPWNLPKNEHVLKTPGISSSAPHTEAWGAVGVDPEDDFAPP